MTTLALTVEVPSALHDIVIAELAELGFDAFDTDGSAVTGYSRAPLSDEAAVLRKLDPILNRLSIDATPRIAVIEDQNWNAEWESSFEPVTAGPFVVAPSWHADVELGDKELIVVDPKMSFGTGHHESTRLILELLPGVLFGGARVLDAGSGTGVLAIAAARLGAREVVAFDIDAWAVENGRENLVRNQVQDVVTYERATLTNIAASEFDVILANINRNALVEMLPGLCDRLAADGHLVIAGLLNSDQSVMERAALVSNLHVTYACSEGDWLSLVLAPIPVKSAPRVAAVDVGTNTANFVIATVDEIGALDSLHDDRRFVRLGEGLGTTGEVSADALRRLGDALEAYAATAAAFEVDKLVVVGTSASRDARNISEIAAVVQEAASVAYEILTGQEEAELSFTGALSCTPGISGTVAVVDIGGGSTELVTGVLKDGVATISDRWSRDIGTVRLTERLFRSQPPPDEDVRRARASISETIGSLPCVEVSTLVGAAGTAVALALLHTGALFWDEDAGPVVLTVDDIRVIESRLLAATYEEVLAMHPSATRGRADLLPMGALIMAGYLEHLGVSGCVVSSRGVRHGLAERELNQNLI